MENAFAKRLAPTYKTYIVVSAPFVENDKEYIMIAHPKTHNVRKARLQPQPMKTIVSQKDLLGFKSGYAYLLTGDDEWCRTKCRELPLHKIADIGWVIEEAFDFPFPATIKKTKISWEMTDKIINKDHKWVDNF